MMDPFIHIVGMMSERGDLQIRLLELGISGVEALVDGGLVLSELRSETGHDGHTLGEACGDVCRGITVGRSSGGCRRT